MSDIGEIILGKSSAGYEVIGLIDRIEGHSEDIESLGENFIDTRLYRFAHQIYTRISGKGIIPEIDASTSFEANMGDAHLLKKFVKYCKTYYPANLTGSIQGGLALMTFGISPDLMDYMTGASMD